MKIKTLAIIFILFLLITLASGLVVLLTETEKREGVVEQPVKIEKPAESVKVTATTSEKNSTSLAPLVRGEKTIEAPQPISALIEEKINATMIIDGVRYEAAVKPGGSVYDLMNLLKAENKIDFFGEYYSGLGFFVETINGLKNNPAGENWVYYINGQPAPVGVSNYLISNNDIIEWKYEEKNF